MPNASILGGSPLGIIGVRSYYNTGTKKSTFNIDGSRNFDVVAYNNNRKTKIFTNLEGNSLFTGYRNIRISREIRKKKSKEDGSSYYDTGGLSDFDGDLDKSSRKVLHGDSLYDISITHIIEGLSGTKAQLRPTDFAYLKNIGVYPNNRLIIARRFVTPTDDNIMVPKSNTEFSAISALITWVKEDENFLDLSFGEEWEEADADFTEVLNNIGNDLSVGGMGNMLGTKLGNAANVLPLSGFMEIFQRQIMAKLGILNTADANMIPSGNPNLIKQAKKEKQ